MSLFLRGRETGSPPKQPARPATRGLPCRWARQRAAAPGRFLARTGRQKLSSPKWLAGRGESRQRQHLGIHGLRGGAQRREKRSRREQKSNPSRGKQGNRHEKLQKAVSAQN